MKEARLINPDVSPSEVVIHFSDQLRQVTGFLNARIDALMARVADLETALAAERARITDQAQASTLLIDLLDHAAEDVLAQSA